MRLTPSEHDRLLICTVAELARTRLRRGVLLNVPEATAIIADAVCEAARDGRSLAQAVEAGRSVLRCDQILPDVVAILTEIQVEAVFDDGTRLAVVRYPFGEHPSDDVGPGGLVASDHPSPVPVDVVSIQVVNESDLPISVGSHFHFFEVNRRLSFDRARAYGRHLLIPAGATLYFPPRIETAVHLVPIGGRRVVIGGAGLVDGALDDPATRERAMTRAQSLGYLRDGAGSDDDQE